jgi:hypothetical protein
MGVYILTIQIWLQDFSVCRAYCQQLVGLFVGDNEPQPSGLRSFKRLAFLRGEKIGRAATPIRKVGSDALNLPVIERR